MMQGFCRSFQLFRAELCVVIRLLLLGCSYLLLQVLLLRQERFDFLFGVRSPASDLAGGALMSCSCSLAFCMLRGGDGFDAADAGAMADSATDANRPISPVARVCVPPQSSFE